MFPYKTANSIEQQERKMDATEVEARLALKADLAGATPTGAFQFTAGAIMGQNTVELTGIAVAGVTYDAYEKVTNVAGTNKAQLILNRHSTTLAPLIVGARSNADTTAETAVTAGQELLSLWGVGIAGSDHKIFGTMDFVVGTGTVSGTSSPGKFIVKLTPNGSTTPAEVLSIDSDGSVNIAGSVTFASASFAGVSLADGTVSAPSLKNTGDTNTGLYFSAEDTIDFTTGGVRALTIGATQALTVHGTTVSTSITTGALIVGGGLGLSGQLYLTSNGNPNPAGFGSLVLSGSSNKERVEIISYGGDPAFQGVRAGGTESTPTQTLSGAVLFVLGATGYNLAGARLSTPNPAIIRIQAQEDFTDTTRGTYINFGVTPPGSSTRTDRLIYSSNGFSFKASFATAQMEFAAGTAAASTAPLKFTSGTLLTTPEVGAVEFLADAFYATITTGSARKTFAFLESPAFTGAVTVSGDLTAASSVFSAGTIELGSSLTGNRASYIDLHSDDTYTDYSGRFLRNAGVNGSLAIESRGTGGIDVVSVEAGNIRLGTNNTLRTTLTSTGVILHATAIDDAVGMLQVNGKVGALSTSATAPAFYALGDTNTGMYFSTADTVDFAVGGSRLATITANGLDIQAGMKTITAAKSANYTVTAADSTIYATTGVGGITLTLPAASSATVGQYYFFYKVDAGVGLLTVAAAGSDTINGAATKTVANQWNGMLLRGDSATSWLATSFTGL